MASTLTPAELTLLGLLTEQPRHGYQLDEVITERGLREWTEIGFSSIYYLLGRLRDRGLVTEVETGHSGRGRARRVYAATAAGLTACAAGAEAALAQLQPLYPPLLVGLANQPLIPRERLQTALAQRTAQLAERIAAVRSAAEANRHAPDFVRAIFDHSLGQLAAEQQWLADYRATLTEKDS